MKKIQLLLIEDNIILRNGITEILKKQEDIIIIGATGNNNNRNVLVKPLKPDIVLLNLSLRKRSSLHIVTAIKKEFLKAKVIVMDLTPVHGDILQFVEAGAHGFILKDTTLDDFLITIRKVANGKKVIPSFLSPSLFSHVVENAIKTGVHNVTKAVIMTKREKLIIRLVSEGLTNKEIGEKLHISVFTVKSYLNNIMDKLSLHTRLEIANHKFLIGNDRTREKPNISNPH